MLRGVAKPPKLGKLLEQPEHPKTFQQLLQEGVQHKGGLAQLAQAEQDAQSNSSGARLRRSGPRTSDRIH